MPMEVIKVKKIKEFCKKIETSKLLSGIIVTVLLLLSIFTIIFYLFLCRLAIIYNATPPDATLPVSLVTGVLAGLVSYCLYQFGLKNSRNKYGIREDGEPYREIINQYLDEV